jgi:uncharacterized membrane protein
VDKFIVPNFHIILIHFPIALLALGVFIELFSFLWIDRPIRKGGHLMILLGALATAPAVTTGLYALSDVVGHGAQQDSWERYKQQSTFTDRDWRFIKYHIILNAAASGVALAAVVIWLGATDHWRRNLHWLVLLMLIVAVGLMVDGAWHGGEMVFRYGFGVQGKQSVLPDSLTQPTGWEQQLEFYIPPGELHLALVGLLFSASALALGFSIRRAAVSEDVVVQRVPPTYVPASAENEAVKPISLLQALNDPGDEIPVESRVPSARFWVLAALLALGAIAGGLWFGDLLVGWPKVIDISSIRDSLRNIKVGGEQRMGMHIVIGASILLLLIVMALLARFAPKSRVVLSGVSLLLILVMATQVWVGVLMLYDGDTGPLTRFKTEAEVNAPPQGGGSGGNEMPMPATQQSAPATQPVAMGR